MNAFFIVPPIPSGSFCNDGRLAERSSERVAVFQCDHRRRYSKGNDPGMTTATRDAREVC